MEIEKNPVTSSKIEPATFPLVTVPQPSYSVPPEILIAALNK
jgi:hypothetical protein